VKQISLILLNFRSKFRSVHIARFALLSCVVGILVLHLLPNPTLETVTHRLIPYDLCLNFLSEFVRTQYGPLMTFNFYALAFTAFAGAWAMKSQGMKREAWFFAVAGVFLVLLALFPTDLVELRRDGGTCGDPTRIEPCTLVGRIHKPLSSVVFMMLGVIWFSLWSRNLERWKSVVRSGYFCFALVVVLLFASSVYLSHLPDPKRHWIGLMQRSIVFPALIWIGFLLERLRTLSEPELETSSELSVVTSP
jgi:hypothetical protein